MIDFDDLHVRPKLRIVYSVTGRHDVLTNAMVGRHHYASEASAKWSIYKWASKGLIDGVEVVREGHGSPVRLRLR